MVGSTSKNCTNVPNPSGGIDSLLEIMRRLRDPQTGCPWDIEQDFASIAPYTIEEAYEVSDAISRQAWSDLCGELGDLLLQVVFHAQIANEAGLFDFDSIVAAISNKMIDRHPHVFGPTRLEKTAQQQTRDWEAQKEAERAAKGASGVLDDVALGLPALMRAQKLQKRAARVGFDWNNPAQVLQKLAEESDELVAACDAKDHDEIEDEMGDLLFVLVNLARHLDVDAETALRRSNDKFTRRFAYVEQALQQRGRDFSQSDLAELEELWQDAKTKTGKITR